jgi:hypothetical protein
VGKLIGKLMNTFVAIPRYHILGSCSLETGTLWRAPFSIIFMNTFATVYALKKLKSAATGFIQSRQAPIVTLIMRRNKQRETEKNTSATSSANTLSNNYCAKQPSPDCGRQDLSTDDTGRTVGFHNRTIEAYSA